MDSTGTEVSRLFYQEAVAPLLAREVPRLRYAAGRLGSGSDVLGLDDSVSRDHDWGCRLTLLVDAAARGAVPQVRGLLERELPSSYRGLPVRFETTWDPAVAHRVEVATAGDFARSRLGADPLRGLSVVDWLTLTGQGILEVTAGPVFADQTHDLGRLREILRWYPPDIERYVLAAGWWQVKARMPNHARAGQHGDGLGSRLIAAAIATDLARLGFLVHRRWPPYSKWLGTLLAALPSGGELSSELRAVTTGPDWRDREDAVGRAAEILLAVQREHGLPARGPALRPYWNRAYRHINAAVPEALTAGITDPEVTRLPANVGSIEQWVDHVELLHRPDRRAALSASYRAWMSSPPAGPSGAGGLLPGQ
jgi:Domain of unknown function (DUF4037)